MAILSVSLFVSPSLSLSLYVMCVCVFVSVWLCVSECVYMYIYICAGSGIICLMIKFAFYQKTLINSICPAFSLSFLSCIYKCPTHTLGKFPPKDTITQSICLPLGSLLSFSLSLSLSCLSPSPYELCEFLLPQFSLANKFRIAWSLYALL